MVVQRSSPRGVLFSLLASTIFAGMFYLAGFVSSSAEVVFAWRVLLTAVCYAAALLHPAARRAVAALWRRLRTRWWMPLLSLLLAAIVGAQLWLFMWAPMHGHGLDTALGFLLLPICLVLGGRFLLHAHVSTVQWVVVGLAAVAVVVKLIATPALSWVTLMVCIPYTVYFVLRQRFGLDGAMVFGLETALLSPLAVALLALAEPMQPTAVEVAALAAIGVGSAVAMTFYLGASSLLSMPVFGLLGYAEPVMLVGVALLLGERMQGADALVYGILAVALAILAVEGFRATRRPRSASGSDPEAIGPR
ncbi:permease [Microbacterium esteraromaticum]|uniref:Permease n=1 Tax=Microbacterium esteraromaticum TaxID=57043 RepID=A0A939DWH7_9MICO|nr:permease [Microbacterium esteraromaticum]MBN8205532.1 permease [Microbacterium esteraromaticum]MBN8415686.1 permease [Microbacterium esteraromaticum]